METNRPTSIWYYEEKGKRIGGIREEELVALIQSGNLGHGCGVWKEGLPNWIKLEDSELKVHIAHLPPPLTGSQINNTVVWILAFAPLIGYMLEWLLAGIIHGNEDDAEQAMIDGGYWYVTIALNIFLGIIDEKRLKSSGHNTSQYRGWVWLVPVYLYQRAKHLSQNLAYVITWLVCFGLMILASAGAGL